MHWWEAVGGRLDSPRRTQGRTVIDPKFHERPVSEAVAQLPDRHRAVIYQSYCLGLTTAQIATELRTDDHLVKQDLHHALHALRAALQSGCDRPIG